MVGGLIQHQQSGLHEQRSAGTGITEVNMWLSQTEPKAALAPSQKYIPGQRDSHPPASGELLGGSALHLRSERQTGQDPPGFGLSGGRSDRPQLLIDLTQTIANQ